MRCLGQRTVIRYHLEFDVEESVLLIETGYFPPNIGMSNRLHATLAEIRTLARDLYTYDDARMHALANQLTTFYAEHVGDEAG